VESALLEEKKRSEIRKMIAQKQIEFNLMLERNHRRK
jgi:hypothetical protein